MLASIMIIVMVRLLGRIFQQEAIPKIDPVHKPAGYRAQHIFIDKQDAPHHDENNDEDYRHS